MSSSESRTPLLIAVALLVGFVVVAGGSSVNALPLFADQTGPEAVEIASLERLDEGCADEISDYASSHDGVGTYAKTTFVETGGEDADLSAWVERTSPAGVDLSTFRVHVDSSNPEPVNASCTYGVQYRIEVAMAENSSAGLLPDAHGHRILWLENGEIEGCSASVTSPLDAECQRFVDEQEPERTWANATTESDAG